MVLTQFYDFSPEHYNYSFLSIIMIKYLQIMLILKTNSKNQFTLHKVSYCFFCDQVSISRTSLRLMTIFSW